MRSVPLSFCIGRGGTHRYIVIWLREQRSLSFEVSAMKVAIYDEELDDPETEEDTGISKGM